MISPIRNERHPYTLHSNIIYFFDWRYVHHGSHTGWLTAESERKRYWSTEPVEPTLHIPGYMPSGIRLRAKPAQKTEPFLQPEGDEDMIWSGGVVMHDEGRYRLWYETAGSEHIDHDKYTMGSFDYIRCAESDDGETWRQPSLGLLERNGTKANNIVYGVPLIDNTGLHGATIFKDASAPAEERYKMFHTGQMGGEMKERYLRDRPDELCAQSHTGKDKLEGFFGAVSADGLNWTPLEDALISQVSDTHNVCEYDPVLGQYVAYCRSHYLMRRSIGRLASPDFRRFPLSEEVFWPNGTNEPYDLWYGNAKTIMPGTTDYHIMFPLRWRLIDDSFAFLLAASPDNVVWNPVPGGPVCRPGEPGDFDYGTVAAGVGLVNLPGDRMGVTVGCSRHGHKQLRQRPDGSINWATWKTGRLAALEAPEEGNFRTFHLTISQRRAYLNFKTAVGGRVEVQVCDSKYQPITGRSYEECDWLVGDEIDRELTWKGEADLGHDGDGPISLSFRMRCAELYSVEFR